MENNARRKKSRVGSDVHPDSPCLLLQHSAMRFVASHPVVFPPFSLNMPHIPGCPQSAMSARAAIKGEEDCETHWEALQALIPQSYTECHCHP